MINDVQIKLEHFEQKESYDTQMIMYYSGQIIAYSKAIDFLEFK